MSSKIITNPKSSIFPGMNRSLPAGCGYFRSLLESNDIEHLQYAASHGNRQVRRQAIRKLSSLTLQQSNQGKGCKAKLNTVGQIVKKIKDSKEGKDV